MAYYIYNNLSGALHFLGNEIKALPGVWTEVSQYAVDMAVFNSMRKLNYVFGPVEADTIPNYDPSNPDNKTKLENMAYVPAHIKSNMASDGSLSLDELKVVQARKAAGLDTKSESQWTQSPTKAAAPAIEKTSIGGVTGMTADELKAFLAAKNQPAAEAKTATEPVDSSVVADAQTETEIETPAEAEPVKESVKKAAKGSKAKEATTPAPDVGNWS